MATIVKLVPFLLLGFSGLSCAQDGTEPPPTTVHINPHLPVTYPNSDESEEHTTHHSNLYRGRPISTVHFGGPQRNHIPTVVETNDNHPPPESSESPSSTEHPGSTLSDTSESPTTSEHPDHGPPGTSESPQTTGQPHYTSTEPMYTVGPATGWRWVYSGGRWHRIRVGSGGTSHGYGPDGLAGHQVVHVQSSETNNWNHAVHHELNSGQAQKNYSRLSDSRGYYPPYDSSSSSGSHSGSGQNHGSSASGESGSSGSGEHSASGSASV
ncbi:uncharacterized protein [Halyomorpha halys]|uniref:uncharacterized protein n=1 Tax=Halyomorpha halys TaxID=286706 RepID=UPI000D0C845B|nr:filaggrin-2 [Halyomorpha halys]